MNSGVLFSKVPIRNASVKYISNKGLKTWSSIWIVNIEMNRWALPNIVYIFYGWSLTRNIFPTTKKDPSRWKIGMEISKILSSYPSHLRTYKSTRNSKSQLYMFFKDLIESFKGSIPQNMNNHPHKWWSMYNKVRSFFLDIHTQ